MAFLVPIMKNFNLFLVEEKPTRSRNMSTCSTSSSVSSTSSTKSFHGSQNSLNSINSSKSTRSNEILYKSRWDLTNPLARLGKLDG